MIPKMMMMTTISHYHIIAITIDSERVMVSKRINKIVLITISITFPSNTSPIFTTDSIPSSSLLSVCIDIIITFGILHLEIYHHQTPHFRSQL